MDTIILASASKGRREIFESLELPYISIPADIDETIPWASPREEITELAVRKAQAAHLQNKERPEKWIAAADTLVIFQGYPMGKPASPEQARQFLTSLSGQEHQVITGLAFMDRTTGAIFSTSDITTVTMGQLTEAEIEWYLSTGEWQGAAGAYRIQHRGAALVEKINGSFSNVIGLPIRKLFYIMKKAGYPAK
ncbi:MAG: Maf family protein [Spirochaetia bacterium]|nr:Maf family protein [Spirochaetia bacterium]